MADCPPIDLAQAIKTAFDAGVAASDFTTPFDCRCGIVFEEKLPELPGANLAVKRPLVDICVQPNPKIDLIGRPRYGHVVPTRIGVRQVLSAACYREDGTIDLEKIRPQLTLFYQLMKYIMPNADHRDGITLATVDAAWLPPLEVVFAYHPDLLETTKQYCGIFQATFAMREAAV